MNLNVKTLSVQEKEIVARVFKMYGPGITPLVTEQIKKSIKLVYEIQLIDTGRVTGVDVELMIQHYEWLSSQSVSGIERSIYVYDGMSVHPRPRYGSKDLQCTIHSTIGPIGRIEYTMEKPDGTVIKNPDHAVIMSFLDTNPALFIYFMWKDVI